MPFLSWFMVKPHTSDIQMTYEFIRVIHGWHTSAYKWYTDDTQVHTCDIQMKYGWHTSTYEWHTNDIQMTWKWHKKY